MPADTCDRRLAGCTLGGAIAVSAFIRDAVTIVHAPPGCSHQVFSMLHASTAENSDIPQLPVVSSGMTENSIIFGGEDALKSALDTVCSGNPALVVVVTSCAAETIGDDSAAVCRSHPDAGKIVCLPTAGFLGGSSQDGENAALTGLSALAEPKPVQPKTAIVIGEKNLESEVEANYRELVRLLDRLGITVTLRFCRNISVADIGRLGSAACYIVRDERVGAAGEAIAKRFGRPYIPRFPVGFSESVSFLREIGSVCGCTPEETETAVRSEREYQKEVLLPFEELRGRRIRFGVEFFGGTADAAREVMEKLGIIEADDGTEVRLPFYLPVGVAGVVRMLSIWRRDLRR